MGLVHFASYCFVLCLEQVDILVSHFGSDMSSAFASGSLSGSSERFGFCFCIFGLFMVLILSLVLSLTHTLGFLSGSGSLIWLWLLLCFHPPAHTQKSFLSKVYLCEGLQRLKESDVTVMKNDDVFVYDLVLAVVLCCRGQRSLDCSTLNPHEMD